MHWIKYWEELDCKHWRDVGPTAYLVIDLVLNPVIGPTLGHCFKHSDALFDYLKYVGMQFSSLRYANHTLSDPDLFTCYASSVVGTMSVRYHHFVSWINISTFNSFKCSDFSKSWHFTIFNFIYSFLVKLAFIKNFACLLSFNLKPVHCLRLMNTPYTSL